jgi:AhpD family alkylhydroperoxidase
LVENFNGLRFTFATGFQFSNKKNHLHMSLVQDFNDYRSKMNEKIFAQNNKALNRFFALDKNAYEDGALDKKTKELLGLIASMVLRCDDCIRYHLGTCYELGVTREEVFEVFAIANLVGGSICIPHTRRAVEYWEELEEQS